MRHLPTSLSTGTRIALLFLLLLAGLLLAGAVVTLLGRWASPDEEGRLAMIYAGTVVQSLIAIAAPALSLAFLTEKRPAR